MINEKVVLWGRKIAQIITIALVCIYVVSFAQDGAMNKAYGNAGTKTYTSYVVDKDHLLTPEEKSVLESKLQVIHDKYNVNVSYYLVKYVTGRDAQDEADLYLEQYHGDGVVLLVATDDRKWVISTYGDIIPVFYDKMQQDLVAELKPSLKAGDWYQAGEIFADGIGERLAEYQADEEGLDDGLWVAAVIGVLGSFFICFGRANSLKSKQEDRVFRPRNLAKEYVLPTSLQIIKEEEKYLATNIIYIKTESSSDTRTHRSSSGGKHGGSSGSF